MGTVWVARRSDGRFEGRAAVKFLNVSFLGGAGEERFKREGSFLARLAHPNIAHLIDAGVSASGQPYLVLEHVEGNQIDTYCNDHSLDTEARIRLFLDVLAAVAHAHANLIVHRDIKPSNVLVTDDGKVKLLDFGIAKLLEDQAPEVAATVLTREGQRALTLAYAAPEQVTGGLVTTGTDVYALGVLLYLLLAGKHPAESSLHSQAALIKAIVDTEPLRPSDVVAPTSKLRRTLRGDLDTIVAKALKKIPAERYESVTAFAEDLRRYLGQQMISARPDTVTYRTRKFVGRNRTAVALAGAALIATGAGVIGTMMQARTARIERDFALRQLSRAAAINDLNSIVLFDAAPSGKPIAVNDLLARAEELVGLQRSADKTNRVELLMSIGSQYLARDEDTAARRVLEQAYTLARALPERSTRARASCALAEALNNDLPRAERLIQEGLNELPDDPRFALDRVVCLQGGSEIASRRKQFHEAITRARGAQRALSQSPFQPEVLELDILILLAGKYAADGQVREAVAAFEQASARLAELGRDSTQQAGVLFGSWAVFLNRWGRPLDAERLVRRAIAIGQRNQAEAVVSSWLLGAYAQALLDLGRLDEAADYGERAYGTHEFLEWALWTRAAIYCRQGNLERATQMLLELEPMLRRNYPKGHTKFGALASQRALIAKARGDTQTALDLANQAVTIVEASIKDGQEGAARELPRFLVRRADIHRQLRHRDEAEGDARGALKMLLHTAQPGTFSSKLGGAYQALGRALQAQGKHEEARAAFRSAVEHLQSALGPDHAETQAARQLAELEIPLR